MKKAKILILTQILVLASLFAAPAFTNEAHASSSGLVCVAPDGSTSCPSTPPVLTTSLNSTQLRVAIFISNSTPINGFDIILVTNHAVLKPASVDLTGTVLLGTPITLVECVGGVLIHGNVCSSRDTVDTLELAAASALGMGDTVAPTTGLLFTAIYNIAGSNPNTPLAFQTGCSGTSVTSGVCVTITNGSNTPNTEGAQGASFSNSPGVPSFAIDANPTALSVPQGGLSTSQIIVTSLNNFTGLVLLNLTVVPPGPTPTLLFNSLLIPPNGQNSTTMDVNVGSTIANGKYNITVSGTSGPLTTFTTLNVMVGSIQAPDFQLSASPAFLSIPQGSSANSTITATSLGGFSGSILVSLGSVVPPSLYSPNLTWQTFINVLNGGTSHGYVIIHTYAGTPVGNYTVTMFGTSGSTSHSLTLTVKVTPAPGFYIKAFSNVLILPMGGTSNSTVVMVIANELFSGTVTLNAPSSPPAPYASLSAITVQLVPNQIINVTVTFFAGNGTLPGLYFINVMGVSGPLRGSYAIPVQVVSVPTPDYAMSVSPGFQTIPAGNNFNYTISLTSLNGFNGIIHLTATVTPSIANQPLATPIPGNVNLSSGGFATATLVVSTSEMTNGEYYTITVTAVTLGPTHTVSVTLLVLAPLDEYPTANFTFTPNSPFAGETISFDGSSSRDPDGVVTSWSWTFGDGYIGSGEFPIHTYSNPGSYTVTLTVQDSSNLISLPTITTIVVISQPAHDVAIVQLYAQPTRVVSTQTVNINIELRNTGLDNETVSVTAYANGQAIQTLKGIFLQACSFNNCFYGYYVTIGWNTNGVAPGNYTISASVSLPAGEVDPTPADNSLTDGTVTVLPAPIITLSPNSGPVGTKVQIQATGFSPQLGNPYPEQLWITFDNNFLGEAFNNNGNFTFTFDVILAQPGTHQVMVQDLYTLAKATASFTIIQAQTGSLVVTIDMGTIYFPGDTATAYVLTTVNGVPVGQQNVQLQVILFKPDGTNLTLTAAAIGTGVYKATYTIPSTGAVLGTYLVVAKVHQPGPSDASSLVSFEVKLTWLNSNGGKITVGATTLAGVIGIGATVAWKKGYLRRKNGEETSPTFPF